jgi:hypothetical protein
MRRRLSSRRRTVNLAVAPRASSRCVVAYRIHVYEKARRDAEKTFAR